LAIYTDVHRDLGRRATTPADGTPLEVDHNEIGGSKVGLRHARGRDERPPRSGAHGHIAFRAGYQPALIEAAACRDDLTPYRAVARR
jgi:hypothetical protein